jgi:[amino group carrier protein]-lysine/ornithine hydrolase
VDEPAALLRLLRPYSPSGREGPAVRAFVGLARELGYTTRVDGVGNGLARKGSGRPRVLFLGHIDTVPGRRPVRRHFGRVQGRGAVDAKGALAAALLAGAGFSGPGSLEIVAAVGEETDSRGARHLVPRRGVDAVIAGEPSRWDGITVGYKGDLRLDARFRGRRSHYSSPTPTTTDVALAWAEGVRAWVAGRRSESPFRSLSMKVLGCVSEGEGDDEEVRITVDLRLPPGTSTRSILQELPRDPGRPLLAVTVRIEPVETGRGDPVVRALEAGVRAAGGRPTLWRKGGTSDWNLVAPAWRVPGAAYGPGDPHLDHTAKEAISERELHRSVVVLRTAFARLAVGLSPTGPVPEDPAPVTRPTGAGGSGEAPGRGSGPGGSAGRP